MVADTALQAGETSLVTITFNEAVTGLTNADLTIANGTLSAVSSADGGLTWTATFTPNTDTTDTTNLIVLDNTGVIDAAGNTGLLTTNSNNYAIDTLRPTVSVVEQGDRIKTAAEATAATGAITVLSEAGATSVVTFVGVNGTVTKTIINDGTALPVLLTAADLVTLGDGLVEVTTVTTDIAGNVTTNADVADGDFTLDTVAPSSPTGGLTHNAINDTGISNTDSITGNASPEISGNGVPGDTITLFDTNGNAVGTGIVAADGTWAINPTINYLVGGLNNLTAVATDPAGNIGSPVTIPIILDNSAPTAIDFVGAGSAEDVIDVALTGTDEIGVIVSITISSVPPASQGTLKLADGTPLVAGAVITPQQAANLIFVPLPNFDGVATILFFVTDDEGLNSADASATLTINEVRILVEQLVTQPNPFANSLEPNRPDPFEIHSPVIPIGIPEDIFVIHSVRESAARIAQSSNFGVFNVDAPTRGELDNLTYDLKGLPVGMDPTLFVQHAVRSLPITQEPRLFVQNAVRQSQLESTMRSIGVNSFNTATSSVSNLFSPFDLGSPNDAIDLSIDGVNGEFTQKTAEVATKQATELALDTNTESVVDINTLEAKNIKIDTPLLQKNLATEPKKLAAASFANQLNTAAKKFKSNGIFNAKN